MKKRLFKAFVLPTAAILPAVALTSCSSQVSQYGINCAVTSNYADTNSEMAKTFKEFSFNNTQISLSSTLTNGNDYSTKGWQGVLAPTLLLLNGLVILTVLMPDLSNPFSVNNMFSVANQDKSLFQEFILASSNLMNQGKKGQIKFGFVGVNTEFSQNNTTEEEVPSEQPSSKNTVSQDSNSVYAASGQTLQVGTVENEKSNTAYYDSNLTFKFSTTLGYWNCNVNKPDQGQIEFQKVIDYVNKDKIWTIDGKAIEPTYKNFKIEFNYSMKIRATYSGLTKAFENAKNENAGENTPATLEENSSTDNTTEEEKPTIKTVTLTEDEYKNIIPSLSIVSYTPFSSGNETKPTTELTSSDIYSDISSITSLLSKMDKTKYDELIKKYANSMTLTATKYSS